MSPVPVLQLRRWRAASVVLTLAILFGLFELGAQPFAVDLIPEPWDKVAHLVVFMALAVALGLLTGGPRWRMLVIAAAGASCIGALDEWHQMFLPGRHAGLDEVAVDVVGAVLGAALLAVASRSVTPPGPDAPVGRDGISRR